MDSSAQVSISASQVETETTYLAQQISQTETHTHYNSTYEVNFWTDPVERSLFSLGSHYILGIF